MANLFDIMKYEWGTKEGKSVNAVAPKSHTTSAAIPIKSGTLADVYRRTEASGLEGIQDGGNKEKFSFSSREFPTTKQEFSYVIPKKKREENDLLVDISFESREWLREIEPAISKSYRNPQSGSKFRYIRARQVHNEELSIMYQEMRKEMKQRSYSEKEISDSYAFVFVENNDQAKAICRHGLKIGNIDNSLIGHPQMGIQLCRHADVLTKATLPPSYRGSFIVFKIMKGHVKAVTENRSDIYLEPTPNFDCHVIKNIQLDINPASTTQLYQLTQVYLYEYGELNVVDYPRHACPIAVVNFQYQGDNKAPRTPEICNSARFGSSFFPSTPNTPSSRADETEFIVWSGQLSIRGLYACSSQMISSSTLIKICKLGTKINVEHKITLQQAREKFFSSVQKLNKQVEVYCNGNFVNICELRPSDGSKYQFLKVRNYLGKKTAVAILKLSGGVTMLIMPDSDLTYQLGLTKPHEYRESLHCIFLSKHSRIPKSSQLHMQHKSYSMKLPLDVSIPHSPSHRPLNRPITSPAMNSVSPNLSPLPSFRRRLLSDSVTSPHLSSLANERSVPGSPVAQNGGSYHRQIDRQLFMFNSPVLLPQSQRPVQNDDKFMLNPPHSSLLSMRTLEAIFKKQREAMNNFEQGCIEEETKLCDSDMDISEDENDLELEETNEIPSSDENVIGYHFQPGSNHQSEVISDARPTSEFLDSKQISENKKIVSSKIRKQEHKLDYNYNPVPERNSSKAYSEKKEMVTNTTSVLHDNSVASKRMRHSEDPKRKKDSNKKTHTKPLASKKQKTEDQHTKIPPCLSEKTIPTAPSGVKIATADDMKNFLNAGLSNGNVTVKGAKNSIKTKRKRSVRKPKSHGKIKSWLCANKHKKVPRVPKSVSLGIAKKHLEILGRIPKKGRKMDIASSPKSSHEQLSQTSDYSTSQSLSNHSCKCDISTSSMQNFSCCDVNSNQNEENSNSKHGWSSEESSNQNQLDFIHDWHDDKGIDSSDQHLKSEKETKERRIGELADYSECRDKKLVSDYMLSHLKDVMNIQHRSSCHIEDGSQDEPLDDHAIWIEENGSRMDDICTGNGPKLKAEITNCNNDFAPENEVVIDTNTKYSTNQKNHLSLGRSNCDRKCFFGPMKGQSVCDISVSGECSNNFDFNRKMDDYSAFNVKVDDKTRQLIQKRAFDSDFCCHCFVQRMFCKCEVIAVGGEYGTRGDSLYGSSCDTNKKHISIDNNYEKANHNSDHISQQSNISDGAKRNILTNQEEGTPHFLSDNQMGLKTVIHDDSKGCFNPCSHPDLSSSNSQICSSLLKPINNQTVDPNCSLDIEPEISIMDPDALIEDYFTKEFKSTGAVQRSTDSDEPPNHSMMKSVACDQSITGANIVARSHLSSSQGEARTVVDRSTSFSTSIGNHEFLMPSTTPRITLFGGSEGGKHRCSGDSKGISKLFNTSMNTYSTSSSSNITQDTPVEHSISQTETNSSPKDSSHLDSCKDNKHFISSGPRTDPNNSQSSIVDNDVTPNSTEEWTVLDAYSAGDSGLSDHDCSFSKLDHHQNNDFSDDTRQVRPCGDTFLCVITNTRTTETTVTKDWDVHKTILFCLHGDSKDFAPVTEDDEMRAASFHHALACLYDEFIGCDDRTVAGDENFEQEMITSDSPDANLDIAFDSPYTTDGTKPSSEGAGESHLSLNSLTEVSRDQPRSNTSEDFTSPTSSRLLANLDSETPVKDEPLLSNLLTAREYGMTDGEDIRKPCQNFKTSMADACQSHDPDTGISNLPQDLRPPTLTTITFESVSDSLLAATGEKELAESPEQPSDTRLVTNCYQQKIMTLKPENGKNLKADSISSEKKENSINEKLQEIAKIDVRSIVLKNRKDISTKDSSNDESKVGKAAREKVNEKRHDRQFHPYTKKEKKKKPWSFETPYNDLSELLQNMSSSTFRSTGRTPTQPSPFGTSQFPQTSGRFTRYKFRRSAVPLTINLDDEEADRVTQDAIPNFEERKKAAEMLEAIACTKGSENDFREEKLLYGEEQMVKNGGKKGKVQLAGTTSTTDQSSSKTLVQTKDNVLILKTEGKLIVKTNVKLKTKSDGSEKKSTSSEANGKNSSTQKSKAGFSISEVKLSDQNNLCTKPGSILKVEPPALNKSNPKTNEESTTKNHLNSEPTFAQKILLEIDKKHNDHSKSGNPARESVCPISSGNTSQCTVINSDVIDEVQSVSLHQHCSRPTYAQLLHHEFDEKQNSKSKVDSPQNATCATMHEATTPVGSISIDHVEQRCQDKVSRDESSRNSITCSLEEKNSKDTKASLSENLSVDEECAVIKTNETSIPENTKSLVKILAPTDDMNIALSHEARITRLRSPEKKLSLTAVSKNASFDRPENYDSETNNENCQTSIPEIITEVPLPLKIKFDESLKSKSNKFRDLDRGTVQVPKDSHPSLSKTDESSETKIVSTATPPNELEDNNSYVKSMKPPNQSYSKVDYQQQKDPKENHFEFSRSAMNQLVEKPIPSIECVIDTNISTLPEYQPTENIGCETSRNGNGSLKDHSYSQSSLDIIKCVAAKRMANISVPVIADELGSSKPEIQGTNYLCTSTEMKPEYEPLLKDSNFLFSDRISAIQAATKSESENASILATKTDNDDIFLGKTWSQRAIDHQDSSLSLDDDASNDDNFTKEKSGIGGVALGKELPVSGMSIGKKFQNTAVTSYQSQYHCCTEPNMQMRVDESPRKETLASKDNRELYENAYRPYTTDIARLSTWSFEKDSLISSNVNKPIKSSFHQSHGSNDIPNAGTSVHRKNPESPTSSPIAPGKTLHQLETAISRNSQTVISGIKAIEADLHKPNKLPPHSDDIQVDATSLQGKNSSSISLISQENTLHMPGTLIPGNVNLQTISSDVAAANADFHELKHLSIYSSLDSNDISIVPASLQKSPGNSASVILHENMLHKTENLIPVYRNSQTVSSDIAAVKTASSAMPLPDKQPISTKTWSSLYLSAELCRNQNLPKLFLENSNAVVPQVVHSHTQISTSQVSTIKDQVSTEDHKYVDTYLTLTPTTPKNMEDVVFQFYKEIDALSSQSDIETEKGSICDPQEKNSLKSQSSSCSAREPKKNISLIDNLTDNEGYIHNEQNFVIDGKKSLGKRLLKTSQASLQIELNLIENSADALANQGNEKNNFDKLSDSEVEVAADMSDSELEVGAGKTEKVVCCTSEECGKNQKSNHDNNLSETLSKALIGEVKGQEITIHCESESEITDVRSSDCPSEQNCTPIDSSPESPEKSIRRTRFQSERLPQLQEVRNEYQRFIACSNDDDHDDEIASPLHLGKMELEIGTSENVDYDYPARQVVLGSKKDYQYLGYLESDDSLVRYALEEENLDSTDGNVTEEELVKIRAHILNLQNTVKGWQSDESESPGKYDRLKHEIDQIYHELGDVLPSEPEQSDNEVERLVDDDEIEYEILDSYSLSDEDVEVNVTSCPQGVLESSDSEESDTEGHIIQRKWRKEKNLKAFSLKERPMIGFFKSPHKKASIETPKKSLKKDRDNNIDLRKWLQHKRLASDQNGTFHGDGSDITSDEEVDSKRVWLKDRKPRERNDKRVLRSIMHGCASKFEIQQMSNKDNNGVITAVENGLYLPKTKKVEQIQPDVHCEEKSRTERKKGLKSVVHPVCKKQTTVHTLQNKNNGGNTHKSENKKNILKGEETKKNMSTTGKDILDYYINSKKGESRTLQKRTVTSVVKTNSSDDCSPSSMDISSNDELGQNHACAEKLPLKSEATSTGIVDQTFKPPLPPPVPDHSNPPLPPEPLTLVSLNQNALTSSALLPNQPQYQNIQSSRQQAYDYFSSPAYVAWYQATYLGPPCWQQNPLPLAPVMGWNPSAPQVSLFYDWERYNTRNYPVNQNWMQPAPAVHYSPTYWNYQ